MDAGARDADGDRPRDRLGAWGAHVFHRGTNGRWADVLTAEDVRDDEERALRELGPACARWLATGELSPG
jgi:aryl sulfotransferase